jgi:hypothetical protein
LVPGEGSGPNACPLGSSGCLVELDDIPVKQVLHNEEKRKTFHFVSRDTHVDDVRGLFSSHEILEAAFITASGKESESLLGMATRWDMLRLK